MDHSVSSSNDDNVTSAQSHRSPLDMPTISSFELPRYLQTIVGNVSNSTSESSLDRSGVRPPKEGFKFRNSIALFGSEDLKVNLYDYKGPLPQWVEALEEKNPVYQIAMLPNELRLSSIFSSLKGSEFDIIALQDVALTYQVSNFDQRDTVNVAYNW